MIRINLPLKHCSYSIEVGNHCLDQLPLSLKRLACGPDAVIITHPALHRLHGLRLEKILNRSGFSTRVLTIPEGEGSKSSKRTFELLNKIASYDKGKKIFVIVLGGGVAGDLGGFVAAIYKRGIPYVQVPTTLVAQIDSAIGGKVAIDLSVGKNLVGAYYHPKLVWVDVALLSTLPLRQIKNGLAEAVKYGAIRDRRLFDFIAQRSSDLLKGHTETFKKLVESCARIKANIVVQDEKETKGIRTLLNFGHTFGHAIETVSRFSRYQHGEAIAIGMRMAAELSLRLGYMSLGEKVALETLLTRIGLPQKAQGVTATAIVKAMQHDKKFQGKRNRFVCLKGIGRGCVVEGVHEQLIDDVVKKYVD